MSSAGDFGGFIEAGWGVIRPNDTILHQIFFPADPFLTNSAPNTLWLKNVSQGFSR